MAGGLFGGGSGIQTDPYIIEDAADLVAIGGTTGAYFSVVNNIDISGVIMSLDRNDGIKLNKLGNIEGNGHTITWTVNEESSSVKTLFGIETADEENKRNSYINNLNFNINYTAPVDKRPRYYRPILFRRTRNSTGRPMQYYYLQNSVINIDQNFDRGVNITSLTADIYNLFPFSGIAENTMHLVYSTINYSSRVVGNPNGNATGMIDCVLGLGGDVQRCYINFSVYRDLTYTMIPTPSQIVVEGNFSECIFNIDANIQIDISFSRSYSTSPNKCSIGIRGSEVQSNQAGNLTNCYVLGRIHAGTLTKYVNSAGAEVITPSGPLGVYKIDIGFYGYKSYIPTYVCVDISCDNSNEIQLTQVDFNYMLNRDKISSNVNIINSGTSEIIANTNKTDSEMKVKDTFITAPWDFDFVRIWGISPDINSGYPHFLWTQGGGGGLLCVQGKNYIIEVHYTLGELPEIMQILRVRSMSRKANTLAAPTTPVAKGLIFRTKQGLGMVELVAVEDPTASKIRVMTPFGIRALKK